MSERDFPEVNITTAVGPVKAMQIACALCDTKGYFQFIKAGKRLPPVAATQHFQRGGWVVGSNARKDLCPKHALRKPETKPMATEIKPEAPKEMSRVDRRIINDKLDEVYATDAYKVPWTDMAVAKDLGVPLHWVESVREQFFGPAGSNPMIDNFVVRLGEFNKYHKAFLDVVGEANALVEKVETMRVDLGKKADDLARIGKQIEKSLGR